MSTVTPAFAQSMAAALNLELMDDGTVRSGPRIVHRLPQRQDGQMDANIYFDFIEWLRQRQPDRLSLVAACAKTGTDYADLCGEPAWMAEKIDQLHDTAKESGARIFRVNDLFCHFYVLPRWVLLYFSARRAVTRRRRRSRPREG